jgi:hypothetical protein
LAANDVQARIAGMRWRAAEARQRAARAEAMAIRLEEQAALPSYASLNQACLRVAALQRRVEARHLTSARLHDQHADHLCAWLVQPDAQERPPAFMDAVAAAIGLRSAAITLLGTRSGEVLVAVSDATARGAHDLEFILGEGPAQLAVARGQTIHAAGTALDERWPYYGPALAGLGVQAVIAVPLQPPACLGAVCGYASQPAISDHTVLTISGIADALPLILAQARHDLLGADGTAPLPLLDEADFLAVIHQAAGMVSQQCGCGISDALALLRARAFATGLRADEVAASVLRGEQGLCLLSLESPPRYPYQQRELVALRLRSDRVAGR